MDVKEAVGRAKEYVADLFAEERIAGVRLEEVVFEEIDGSNWKITISFHRQEVGAAAMLVSALGEQTRSSKVVTIDDHSGRVVSVTNRS